MTDDFSILHLEDDPQDTQLVIDRLRAAGVHARVARVDTFPAFRTRLEAGDFDLIVSDYAMPKLDPLEALQLARRTRPGIPFVFLSGTMGEEAAIETLKLGATDYVLKQRIERLVPALTRALHEAEEARERARAEAEIERGRARYKALVEASAAAVWSTDPQGRMVEASPSWQRFTGQTTEQCRDYGVLHAIHPEDRPRVEAEWHAALGTCGPFRSVFRLRSAAGGYRHVLARAVPVHNEDGSVREWVGMDIDITDQKRAQQALRESEQRYRSFVEASAQVIWETDASGAVDSPIPAWQVYTGQSEEEAAGFGWMNAILPDHWERVREAWRKARETSGIYQVEYLLKRHDGAWRNVLARGVPVKEVDGTIREYIGTCIDITDQRQAEESLRQSELFYRQALESIPGMVFTTRPDGYCDYMSQQWADYTGVALSEQVRDGWNKLLHPDDQSRALAAWRAAVEGHAPYDLEYRVRRRDGEYEWFKVMARPIRDAAGQIARWFGVAANINALKQAEEDLIAAQRSAERARAEAEHANQAKDHFLAVLSHELRTPLTPVLATVSLLQTQAGLDDEWQENLEIIRRNTELEARLIDDLLDLTRIARGKVELDRRLVRLDVILKRAVEVCRPDMEARRLQFGADIAAGPLLVYGDASRLQQVFWNLLKNSIKFTAIGGSIGLRCWRENEQLLTEVSDSGIGIEPEALGRIFNAFEQAERSTTRQFGGLGLGLAISRALIELHGGSIVAQSPGRNQGATFTVRLPAHAADRLESRRVEHDRPGHVIGAAPSHNSHLRILLVEDHGDTARIIARLLRRAGHAVHAAGDAAAALAEADKYDFDVLVSDLGLPDRSGLDLIRELRARGKQFPAIAMTGFGQEEDVRRTREAGFTTHLTKPIDMEQLESAIAALSP